MVLSKLDLAIVAVIAVGSLWIEHEHRIIIGTPAAAEAVPPAASACPDKDSVPFSADCIAFIDGGALPDIHASASAMPSTPLVLPDRKGRAESDAAACPPSNENAPYSARCIRFLSGWYWQANPTEAAP
jgi:hypothetical protein